MKNEKNHTLKSKKDSNLESPILQEVGTSKVIPKTNTKEKVKGVEIGKEVGFVTGEYDYMPSLVQAAKSLVGSSGRFKKVEDIVLAAQWARDAGVSLSSVMNKGYVLNGVVSVEYPVLLAILRKHDVRIEILEDCVPMYNYKYKNSIISHDDYQREKESYRVFTSMELLTDAFKIKKADDKRLYILRLTESNGEAYDYRTKVRAKRIVMYNGNYEEDIVTVSFKLTDAETAELTGNAVWNKYLSDMLFSKVVPRLINRIGSDLVHCALDAATAHEIHNKNYDYSERRDDNIVITNP